ncbi:vWA domain-containing protein [Paucisalibacillus sp. EB02]|uniref:vWA domain-containing protein n=1 Tax=Paucisalibacillus sp. EB02 TaxID=1347087 RepID=UPI0004BB8E4C|nr:vWA domain-containing protein [Paucisalibacillus sp. EB02]
MKTEIIFLLDRSGSMSGLEKDTIGGFNAIVEKQSKLKGETTLTTVLFDHEYELLWNGIDAREVKLTEKNYFVRGSTALLDAIGKTIMDVSYRLSNTKPEVRADNVLFVITTDGFENASWHYSYKQVKKMIVDQQKNHGWEFMFLGANIDAASEAGNLGIDVENSFSYKATDSGVEEMYDVIHEELSVRRVKE